MIKREYNITIEAEDKSKVSAETIDSVIEVMLSALSLHYNLQVRVDASPIEREI